MFEPQVGATAPPDETGTAVPKCRATSALVKSAAVFSRQVGVDAFIVGAGRPTETDRAEVSFEALARGRPLGFSRRRSVGAAETLLQRVGGQLVGRQRLRLRLFFQCGERLVAQFDRDRMTHCELLFLPC